MLYVWRLTVLALATMAALQISCDLTPSSTTTNPDPPHGKITKIDAPSILCDTNSAILRDSKSAAPISVAVVINPNLTVPQYCSVSIFEDLYVEIGDRVACDSQSFTASGTIVFNNFDLTDGRYIVIAGLSYQPTCTQWVQYDTTAWHYLIVGGDSCATWRTFAFDYYRQSTLEALPLGLSDVQQSFDPARISLDMYTVGNTLPFEQITVQDWGNPSPTELVDYMVNHVQPGLGFSKHLFAVRRFVNTSGQVFPVYGRTLYRDEDEPCFVCVSRLTAAFYPDTIEAVSSTTIHELGHLIGRLTDACEVAPDSHVVGQCIMEDIAYYNWALSLYCGYTDQYWPYMDVFCDSCVRRLKAATW